MKTILNYIQFFGFFLLFVTCNTSEKKQSVAIEKQAATESYTYGIDTTGISLVWTAYKFTNKVGVSGTFDTLVFSPKNGKGSVEQILKNSKLRIPTTSVNTANPIRDFKLNTYFFKTFNTSEIKGSILTAKDGEGIVKLVMNRTSKKIPFTYSYEKDTIRLFTNLNLTLWKAEEALKTLNEECYELHKGADGNSKLWPDVDVVIKLTVKKVPLIN
jgi:hypothetical protein